MPIAFYFIVGAQFAIYLAIVARRRAWREGWRGLWMGILAGVPIGALFDLIAGRLGIHAYLGATGSDAFCRCGLDTLPLVLNGALSYGLAIATASLFPLPRLSGARRGVALPVLFTALLLASLIGVHYAARSTFAAFLATRFAIVAASELALLLRFGNGYITLALRRRDATHLLRVWKWSIAIGAIYELLNGMFPFRIWLPGNSTSRILVESFVIALSYVGLFYPFLAFWRFTRKETRE